MVMALNTTFNNISVLSWKVGKTRHNKIIRMQKNK